MVRAREQAKMAELQMLDRMKQEHMRALEEIEQKRQEIEGMQGKP